MFKQFFLFLLLYHIQLISQAPDSLYLKGHIEYLASPELEGRQVASRGETLAARYIESELIKYGIQPLPELASYRVPFPLLIKTVSDGSCIVFSNGGSSFALPFGKEFFSDSYALQEIKDSMRWYYAGTGIDDTAQGFFPYQNVSVRGKYVAVQAAAQKANPEINVQKVIKALQAGAVGVILVLGDDAEPMLKELHDEGVRRPAVLRDGTQPDLPPIFMMSSDAFRHVIKICSDGNKLPYQQTDYTSLKPMLLPIRIYCSLGVTIRNDFGTNLIGYIPGKEQGEQEEFVVVSAHYDHLGKNDTAVYSGADDDASGVAVILESARLLKKSKSKRSLLFIFHSGEEGGLLGSKFLTANLSIMKRISALINIDMIGRGHSDTLFSIGSNRKTKKFQSIVEQVNRKSAKFVFNYTLDQEDHPERLYERSDHINYANQGIPIVFLYDYMKEDYHQPGDIPAKINYKKMVKAVQLVQELLLELASTKKSFHEKD